jgi:peptide deformylase
MAILKVARMGHPVLRAKAQALPPSEIKHPRIQQLIDDMFATMREYSGIGLAAPQVHEGLRLFVAGVRAADSGALDLSDDADMPFIALINPEITPRGGDALEGWEGCLSIPDIRGLVPRANRVHVQAYDRQGRAIEFEAQGLPARVIQHETDHLDGVLFFDRMATFESLAFNDEYRRYWMDDEEA